MLHACVKIGNSGLLFGVPASRLFIHLPGGNNSSHNNNPASSPDGPWGKATPADLGACLPDGLYAAYIRVVVALPVYGRRTEMTRPIHLAAIRVVDHVARLLVMAAPPIAAHVQHRGQVLVMYFAPVLLSAQMPKTLASLHTLVAAWFHQQHPWWPQYLPHAMDAIQVEWSMAGSAMAAASLLDKKNTTNTNTTNTAGTIGSTTTGSTTMNKTVRSKKSQSPWPEPRDPLLLVAEALGYRHPLLRSQAHQGLF